MVYIKEETENYPIKWEFIYIEDYLIRNFYNKISYSLNKFINSYRG